MPSKLFSTDVLIIGASAAGLMCAIEAGKRGRRVMVLAECKKVDVVIRLDCEVGHIEKTTRGVFAAGTSQGIFQAASLVIASSGLSLPKMCASPLGYKVAEQFGHRVWPTSAGLVPFTLQPQDKERLAGLSGIAVAGTVSTGHMRFNENILFTHRGLSSPAILQITSYWTPGEAVTIDLLARC